MPAILAHQYVLAVPDRHASARFYVEALGFRIVADPPGWIFVARDACTIRLGECPDALPPARLGDHGYFAYLVVDDADALLASLVSKGVAFVSAIEDRSWGMREFGIRTADGHRIMIGQVIKCEDDA